MMEMMDAGRPPVQTLPSTSKIFPIQIFLAVRSDKFFRTISGPWKSWKLFVFLLCHLYHRQRKNHGA
jgi:hypothetical protein